MTATLFFERISEDQIFQPVLNDKIWPREEMCYIFSLWVLRLCDIVLNDNFSSDIRRDFTVCELVAAVVYLLWTQIKIVTKKNTNILQCCDTLESRDQDQKYIILHIIIRTQGSSLSYSSEIAEDWHQLLH